MSEFDMAAILFVAFSAGQPGDGKAGGAGGEREVTRWSRLRLSELRPRAERPVALFVFQARFMLAELGRGLHYERHAIDRSRGDSGYSAYFWKPSPSRERHDGTDSRDRQVGKP
jgi:hypothetical protein